MTVRDHVKAAQAEMRRESLTPERAAILANQLSALVGNIADEQRGALMAFNAKRQDCRTRAKSAADAQIEAETTAEYERWVEAKDTMAATEVMIRTLLEMQRTYREEMRLAR